MRLASMRPSASSLRAKLGDLHAQLALPRQLHGRYRKLEAPLGGIAGEVTRELDEHACLQCDTRRVIAIAPHEAGHGAIIVMHGKVRGLIAGFVIEF